MESNKKYFHELSEDDILYLMSNKKNWGYIIENYLQPDWCTYHEALGGNMGCWSLTDLTENGSRNKISKEFCKNCEMCSIK